MDMHNQSNFASECKNPTLATASEVPAGLPTPAPKTQAYSKSGFAEAFAFIRRMDRFEERSSKVSILVGGPL